MDGTVDAASPEQRLVGGVDDRVHDLLRDVAEGDLDASGHGPVSIDFANAPTPILSRRPRLQPQDAREGRGAPGRHGVPRPRGRGRAAGEERRHPPERGGRAHIARLDGPHAGGARQRHRHGVVLPRHPLRGRGLEGGPRLHHAAEGPGPRSRRLRPPPADATRGRAGHAQANRARDPDRERAGRARTCPRSRMPPIASRRSSSGRGTTPPTSASRSSASARSTRSIPETSGTPSSRAS